MILNRLGLNNLVEPITKYLEFQRQDSFLLYRNIKEQGEVNEATFYNPFPNNKF